MEQEKKAEKSNDISINQIFDPDCEYEIVETEMIPEQIICPDCGGYTREGLEFCDKCGGELETEKIQPR